MHALNLKQAPSLLDFSALLPPDDDYSYFDAAQTAPLRPRERAFHLTNATWLADAALLAYAPPDSAWETFENAGFKQGEYLNGPSTQAFVALTDDYILVAFRGSQVNEPIASLIDWILVDADFIHTPWGGGGHVHEGFLAGLNEVWSPQKKPGLKQFLADHLAGPSGPRGVVHRTQSRCRARHACGGPLCDRDARPCSLYTYASPRVGDAAFAAAFPVEAAFRLVNNNDVIPRVPHSGLGFKHVGDPWFIDDTGKLRPGTTLLKAPGDTMHGPSIDLIGAMKLNIVDHAPIFYATYIWNAFVASRSGSIT